MESVEDLMVGKETAFLVVVDEALVQGLVHGHKPHLIALQFLTLKNILESLLLLAAVGQYI